MSKIPKRKNLVQAAALLLLLVILPAGSWFYLRSGFQHRKAAIEELGRLGTVGAFEFADQYGNPFSTELMRNRVTIAGFLPQDPAKQRQWASRLGEVHDQFDDRNDVCFVLFADSSTLPDPMNFALENGLSDSLQWEILSADREELKGLASQAFFIPDYQHIALVDTGLTVRRHYDILDNPQMGRLIEHITIVMPRLPDPDIILKREQEK